MIKWSNEKLVCAALAELEICCKDWVSYNPKTGYGNANLEHQVNNYNEVVFLIRGLGYSQAEAETIVGLYIAEKASK